MPKAGVRLLLSGYTVASMPKAGVQHQLLRIYSIHAEGWGAASTSQGMASMPKAGVRLLLFSDSATLPIESIHAEKLGVRLLLLRI